MHAAFVHGKLALLAEASGAKLAREALLDIGVDARGVPAQVVTTGELLATRGTGEASLALVLDRVVFDQRVLAREALGACGHAAAKPVCTVGRMHLGQMPLELAASPERRRTQ